MFKMREKQNFSDAENTFDKVQHSFIIFKMTEQIRKHFLQILEGYSLNPIKGACQPIYKHSITALFFKSEVRQKSYYYSLCSKHVEGVGKLSVKGLGALQTKKSFSKVGNSPL